MPDSAFGESDYRALLEAADYEGISEIPVDELRDMCLLVLQDLKPSDAAILVLRHHLGDRMTPGQVKNLAHELGDERHWEHYADMALHEGIFHVSALMWAAFPSDYPPPDAVGLSVELTAADDEARALLDSGLSEPLLIRLLAGGMAPNAMLHRLFGDQLAGTSFPQASWIVWTSTASTEGEVMRIEVTGANAWLGPLRRGQSWESGAWPDVVEDDAD